MKEGGGVTNACICMGTEQIGRDEVIMALHMRIAKGGSRAAQK